MNPILSIGPNNATIAIVSEFPSKEDISSGEPFTGAIGDELDRQLFESGLLVTPRGEKNYYVWAREIREERKNNLFISTVFPIRPPGGDIEQWCASKGIVSEEYDKLRETLISEYPNFPWPSSYTWGNIGKGGKYLRPQHLKYLPKLKEELENLSSCNIVITLGPLACWALTGDAGIKKSRGYTTMGSLVDKKVLPTWHPSYVLKVWDERVIAIADLRKALRQSKTKELNFPQRKIWVNPTLEDLEIFEEKYIQNSTLLSVDIETAYLYRMPLEQVSAIGFAPSNEVALVVPFIDPLRRRYSYWKSDEEEIAAWKWCVKILTSNIPKLGQNFNFDFQYLIQQMGIGVRNVEHDLMFQHHSLHAEMLKSLEFLGSLYSDSPSWKSMAKDSGKED